MAKPVDNSDLLKQIQKLQGQVKQLQVDLQRQEKVTDPYIETLEALRLSGALAIKVVGFIAVVVGMIVALRNLFWK